MVVPARFKSYVPVIKKQKDLDPKSKEDLDTSPNISFNFVSQYYQQGKVLVKN